MAYINETGLPSVTTVLSEWISKEWFTEESRERGTAVHEACHAYLMGAYVVPLRESWQGYFDSFKRWVDAVDPVVELSEKRLIDERSKYCGQPDFIGKARALRSGRGLIDWKTSVALERWFRLQGAAYRSLADVSGYGTEWGGNLRLKADGSMPLFNYWPDAWAADYGFFFSCLVAWRFFNS